MVAEDVYMAFKKLKLVGVNVMRVFVVHFGFMSVGNLMSSTYV